MVVEGVNTKVKWENSSLESTILGFCCILNIFATRDDTLPFHAALFGRSLSSGYPQRPHKASCGDRYNSRCDFSKRVFAIIQAHINSVSSTPPSFFHHFQYLTPPSAFSFRRPYRFGLPSTVLSPWLLRTLNLSATPIWPSSWPFKCTLPSLLRKPSARVRSSSSGTLQLAPRPPSRSSSMAPSHRIPQLRAASNGATSAPWMRIRRPRS